MRDEQQREIHHVGDVREVPQRVVGELRVDERVHGERARGGGGDGVAVGRRRLQRFEPDDAVRAGAIVDGDLLAEPLGELLSDDAADEIDAAARRETAR